MSHTKPFLLNYECADARLLNSDFLLTDIIAFRFISSTFFTSWKCTDVSTRAILVKNERSIRLKFVIRRMDIITRLRYFIEIYLVSRRIAIINLSLNYAACGTNISQTTRHDLLKINRHTRLKSDNSKELEHCRRKLSSNSSSSEKTKTVKVAIQSRKTALINNKKKSCKHTVIFLIGK